MGSFAFTCAVSGLAIHAGTPVRYFLLTQSPYSNPDSFIHGSWFVRTPPIRALYNDYGSIRGELPEEQATRDAILALLRVDLVEKGVGSNTVHDVAVPRTIEWGAMLRAIWERRLFVLRQGDQWQDDTAIPEGVPTDARVSRALATLTRDVFVVEELYPGNVRVRWDGSGDRVNKLKKALSPLLRAGFAAMIVASEDVPWSAEILVRVKPGVEGWQGCRRMSEEPLLVQQAMIREDVWQALLREKIGTHTLVERKQLLRAKIKESEESLIRAKELEALALKHPEVIVPDMTRFLFSRTTDHEFGDSVLHSPGPGAHLVQMLRANQPIPESTIESVAELYWLQWVLGIIRYQWRPSYSSGPQFGEWADHRSFFAKMQEIAGRLVEEERSEREAAERPVKKVKKKPASSFQKMKRGK